ncbi:transcription factor bHLH143-like [Musa acuminata AAA Group]|uniref:transcription factor bHLH143-like n=1 Tax=Musa acuminata AAA Group TaxID=214697 RepID=UPI0031D2DE50
MKKNLNPWLNFPHQMQRFSSLNSATDLMEPNIGRQNNPPTAFPTYIKHCGCVVPSNTTIMFPEIQALKSFEMASSIKFSAIPMFVPPDFGGSTKRLPVLNQSWERTGLDLSSSLHPYRTLNHANESLDIQGSNETVHIGHEVEEMHEDLSSSLHPNRTLNHANESLDVQGSNETVHIGHEVEEVHEDSEEIDALLYSDSDDDDSREEEDASTGHSPFGPMTGSSSEVASSIFPVKRKRLDEDEPDALLLDTATSGGHHGDNSDLDFNKHRIEGGDSSCVRGEDQDRKRLKRERILEIVSALRRIIPGGEGKDAATVIDEAICYVKSLKLKAKDLGAATW